VRNIFKKKKKAKPIELPKDLIATNKIKMHYDTDDFASDLDLITDRLKNVDISEYRVLKNDSKG
tara:strand:+ start:3533 stop:3724 length:192 start_codon:yes stop_codon:yes gene_type:complete